MTYSRRIGYSIYPGTCEVRCEVNKYPGLMPRCSLLTAQCRVSRRKGISYSYKARRTRILLLRSFLVALAFYEVASFTPLYPSFREMTKFRTRFLMFTNSAFSFYRQCERWVSEFMLPNCLIFGVA